MLLHHLVIEWLLALDTALGRETSVRFNDLLVWDTSPSFKGIDILGKTLIQKGVFRKETNEGVCNCRTEFPWVEFMCKGVNFARKIVNLNLSDRIWDTQGTGLRRKKLISKTASG